MTRNILAFLTAAALLLIGAPAFAQVSNAVVVSDCGTPPGSYTAGQNRQITQDTSGYVCTAATATGSFDNAAVSATGSGVPGSASYGGLNLSGNIVGQTAANPSGSIYAGQVDLASVAGTTTDTGAGASSPGTLRVIQSSDSKVQPIAGTSGGCSVKSFIVANNTTSVAVKASAGNICAIVAYNNSATIAYLKVYNAVQGSTTCGSGTPVERHLIPSSTSGAGFVVPLAIGDTYATAITVCVTTGIADNDTGAPAASTYLINVYYK